MLKTIRQFLCPQAVSLSPAVAGSTSIYQQAVTLAQNGAMMDNGALVAALQALVNNAAPSNGLCKFTTSASQTPASLADIAGLTARFTAGAAVTINFDNAYNIVNTIPGPFVGMTFPLTIVTNAGSTIATPGVTVALGSGGVTLSGTTSSLASALRAYQGTITQLYASTAQIQPLTAGTTFTSLAQVAVGTGQGNVYTLTIAGNAVLTTVGNIIYLPVTAGTLPAGWYEIIGASATVPTIVAPVSGTAWTATAMGSMTQPATAPQVYAPLVTITGLYTVGANVAV